MKLHTYNIVTFGWQMNVNESDWLERSLQNLGFTKASEQEAQVHIINTCSVRAKPVQKVYSLLGSLEKLTIKSILIKVTVTLPALLNGPGNLNKKKKEINNENT